MRAYAAFDAARLDEGEGSALLGKGLMGVTIDQGQGQPYQGVTPLAGESLAESAEIYFAQSEQLATRFALSAAQVSAPGERLNWRAGGIVIQHLPKASPLMAAPQEGQDRDGLMTAAGVAALTGDDDGWSEAVMKLATVETHELLGPHVPPDELLLRLFNEDAPRVYEAQPVAFGCTCGAAKLEGVLAAYDRGALEEMAEDGRIVADCQFCGRSYSFAVDDLVAGAAQG